MEKNIYQNNKLSVVIVAVVVLGGRGAEVLSSKISMMQYNYKNFELLFFKNSSCF